MTATVLVFHPHLDRSHANRALADRAAQEDGVTVRDMYGEYPDLRVDGARERMLVANADLLVFQFPLYWYSAPALLKEWEDATFDPAGHGLEGKRLLLAVTAGGRMEDYAEDGKHGASMGQVLLPYRIAAKYLNMVFEEPLVLGHVHHIPDDELVAETERYARMLH